jgi:hypothetical protein
MKFNGEKKAMDHAAVLEPDSCQCPHTRSSETRRQPRRAYSGRVLRSDDGREFAALDLSAEGVGLLSSEPLRAGQHVELAFLDGSIVVKGSVCHVRHVDQKVWRVGIDFLQDEHELAEVALALG